MGTIIFEYSAWFILLCILLAFGYAFGLYFRDRKLEELSKSKIWLLATLRFFSSLIISLLLLAPLLKSISTTIEDPIVIFANDNTESILLSYDSKQEQLTNIQQSIRSVFENISNKYNTFAFSFGNNIDEGLKYDYSGKQTNIEGIFDEITNKFYNKNIGALVLISDGIFTNGLNPVYKIENINFPIYTIAVGDTTTYKDLLIKDLIHNEIAFLNNKFPVEVTIAAKKMKGETAVCKIVNDGKIIHTENFEITENDYLKKITFFVEAQKSGIHRYNVSLTKFSGERNTLNNYSSFSINILENKQKILILANSPHPDIAAIRNAMKINQNFEVDFQIADKFEKDLTEYSLVILHQLPSTKNGLTTIYPKLIQGKIPILIVLGTQTDYTRLNNLNIGLKVNQLNNSFDDAQGYPNTNFADFDIKDDLEDLLKATPPLIVPFGDFNLNPQAKTVLYQKVKNINTLKPLITVANPTANYESNVGFILGEGIWRWRLIEFQKNNSFEIFDNTINQLIQFLVLKDSKNRFIVKVKNLIPENDEIVFKAEVYNKIFELTNEETVDITIKDSTGRTFEYKMQKTNNSYYLNIGNMPVGKYSYSAKTKLGEENLTTGGVFAVVNENAESQNLIANHSLLYKLSNQSGGKFLYSDNIDSLNYYLENDSNIIPVSYSTQDLTEFIKYKWIFFLILALLSVEWFLRKFFGTY